MQDQPSENNHRVKHNAHLVDGFGAHDGLVLAVEIAALLGLICTTFIFPVMTKQAGLFLSTTLICAILHVTPPTTERSPRVEWLVEHSLTLTALIMTCVLGAALVLWAIVSFWWQPAYEAQVTAVVLHEQDIYVTVSHPGGILANGHPVLVQIDVANRSEITQTVGITTVLPINSHLQFATPPTLPILPVSPQSHLTQTIALANSSPLANFIVTQQLTTIVSRPGAVAKTETTLTVEGSWGLRLRSLVNSTVDQASPLILLIAFLAPALAQATQHYVKERKARQQEEKRQLLLQHQEAQKQAASQLVQKLRYGMAVGDWSRVGQLLTELSELEWKATEPDDRGMAKRLLSLAKLECKPDDIASIIQECAVWNNECVTAFLSAWEIARQREDEQSQKCFAALKKARHLLPASGVNNELVNRLANLETSVVAWEKDNFEFQPIRDWPKPPQRSAKFPEESAPFLQAIPGKQDPFAYERAEDDLHYLFNLWERRSGAFWGGHSLFRELFGVDRVTLVFAESGNGSTALAHGLHYYAAQREVFTLHLPGNPKPSEIRAGLVAHLLDFILTYPIYLRQLTLAQRQLLAHLLVSDQTALILCARIEAKQAAIYSTFSTTPANEKDDEVVRLHLLANDVRTASPLPEADDTTWVGDIVVVTQALGFARVVLVLDASNSDDCANWLQDGLGPLLLSWQRQGLFSVLFLPDDDEAKQIAARMYHVNGWQLTWSRTQIERMLTWRYKAFAGPRPALQQHFEEGAFDYFVSHCLSPSGKTYCPRTFIRNWHSVTAQLPPGELITKAYIEQHALTVITDESELSGAGKEEAETVASSALEATADLTDDVLHKILKNYFALEELHTLCFYLGENYEGISVTRNINDFARDMVVYFRRRDRLPELILRIREERPQLSIGEQRVDL